MDQTVDKEQMKALQFLAETNLKIGEARGLLTKLQEDETKYLVVRENRALERIMAVLEKSKELIDQSAGNFEKVKELFDMVSAFAELLAKAYADFQRLIVAWEEKNELQEAKFATIQDNIALRERDIQVQNTKLENGKKSLSDGWKRLGDDQRKLALDRSSIDNAIKRLKEGRI